MFKRTKPILTTKTSQARAHWKTLANCLTSAEPPASNRELPKGGDAGHFPRTGKEIAEFFVFFLDTSILRHAGLNLKEPFWWASATWYIMLEGSAIETHSHATKRSGFMAIHMFRSASLSLPLPFHQAHLEASRPLFGRWTATNLLTVPSPKKTINKNRRVLVFAPPIKKKKSQGQGV